MRIKLLALLALISVFTLRSQNVFQKTYGKIPQDYGYAIDKTRDGGYIVSGITNGYGGTSYLYLLKLDSIGDTSWVKAYATTGLISGFSVQQTADSGYIVCGNNGLIKTNPQGIISWGFQYNGVSFYSAQQTSDGGYIVSGTIGNSSSSNGMDIFILKLNTNGIKQWSRKLGGSLDDASTCIRQTPDGGYISLGCTNSFGAGNTDLYLIKTNSLGDTLWTKTYGGTSADGSTSVRQNVEITGDGGYIIGSFCTSFGGNGSEAYLIKTDANGDTLWSKTYGGSGAEAINGLKQTSDGGYILTGYTTSFGGGLDDVYLIKTKANGDTLWTRAFGGINTDYGLGVVEANDKGFVIVGYTKSFALNNDVFLIKTDSLGNSTCNQFSTATQVNAVPTLVGATSTGKIFITLNSSVLSPTFRGGGTITDVCSTNEIKLLEEQKSVMHIYPNPNNGFFTVHFPENISGKLVINSLLGETVYTSTLQNNSIIDLSALPNGVYFLKAETTKIYTQRIIINK